MVSGEKCLRQTGTISNSVYRDTLMVHIYHGDIVEYLHQLENPHLIHSRRKQSLI